MLFKGQGHKISPYVHHICSFFFGKSIKEFQIIMYNPYCAIKTLEKRPKEKKSLKCLEENKVIIKNKKILKHDIWKMRTKIMMLI
jgi:hypothetical protein